MVVIIILSNVVNGLVVNCKGRFGKFGSSRVVELLLVIVFKSLRFVVKLSVILISV